MIECYRRIFLQLFKLNNIKYELLLASVTIFWGVTFLIVQDAINSIPVFSFLFYRFGVASLLMLLISYNRFKYLNKSSIRYGIILGILLFLGYATQTYALIFTTSTIVAFLTGLFVVFVPLLSYIFLKETININVLIASFISFIGLYFLTMSGSLDFGFGEILGVFCAFFIALHLIATGKLPQKLDIFIVVTIQFITITILSLIISLIFEQKTINIQFSPIFIKAIIITSIFATVYAFIIQTYVQQFISSTKTAIICTLEPISAAFYGVIIGGEILITTQYIGAVLIILATVIAEIKFSKKGS